jgi:aminoglycoside phosphotransferase
MKVNTIITCSQRRTKASHRSVYERAVQRLFIREKSTLLLIKLSQRSNKRFETEEMKNIYLIKEDITSFYVGSTDLSYFFDDLAISPGGVAIAFVVSDHT